MFLIRYKDNWADEMNVEGFLIISEFNWHDIVVGIPASGRLSRYIGSNQQTEWKDRDAYLRCLKIDEITFAKAQELSAMFGRVIRSEDDIFQFGMFACPSENW